MRSSWRPALRSCSRTRSTCSTTWPAACSKASPCAVSTTGVRPRSTSGAPAQVSSARMRRPKAGCVTWRNSAARTKLPVCANAIRSSKSFRSDMENRRTSRCADTIGF
ncbi:Uncharacterised protein [Bordetella pertussis]|nr:Uncharacterised protein [Bordetella pertussis]